MPNLGGQTKIIMVFLIVAYFAMPSKVIILNRVYVLGHKYSLDPSQSSF